MKPIISIVIPVYNGEKYLPDCLDSVLGQTMADLEVICVDDASTDSTYDILNRYQSADRRLKVIRYNTNKTAAAARKDGILAAAGEHIWFVDADDIIEKNACEALLSVAEEHPADILHFGTHVINASGTDSAQIAECERFVKPYAGSLNGTEVFVGCFQQGLYQFTLWNKLFSAAVCKQALVYAEDGPLPVAQDKYLFFILSYFARSYYGIPELYLYRYRFGAGIWGKAVLTFEQFSTQCKAAWVADAIERFLVSQQALELYAQVNTDLRQQLLTQCVEEWTCRVPAGNKAQAYDEMLRFWRADETVGVIAKRYWDNISEIASILDSSACFKTVPQSVKTIGVYYHCLSIGGAEYVTVSLIRLWRSLGYHCVLITDDPPGEEDYPLPPDVPRVQIPSYFTMTPDNYAVRGAAWLALLKQYRIDTVVYHAWVALSLPWDMMIIKSLPVNLLIHCHSVFSCLLDFTSVYWADMPLVYRLADGVVTLSKADRYYWSQFNRNTFLTVNPIAYPIDTAETSALATKNIVWVGRLSDEKRPFDAVEILAKVIKKVPDAKLYMVGGCFERAGCINDLVECAARLGAKNAVVFCGFQKEVKPYYLDASVFLMTSVFEGFPLALFEAKLSGLPCVMYELPHLALAEGDLGILPVGQGDISGAAEAIIGLLQNQELRSKLGTQAKEHAEALRSADQSKIWMDIFDSFLRPTTPPVPDEVRIMWNTLLKHYRIGAASQADRLNTLTGTDMLRSEAALIRASLSYRIGRLITFVPRKIAGGIRCLQEHGPSYTRRRLKEQLVGFFRLKPE